MFHHFLSYYFATVFEGNCIERRFTLFTVKELKESIFLLKRLVSVFYVLLVGLKLVLRLAAVLFLTENLSQLHTGQPSTWILVYCQLVNWSTVESLKLSLCVKGSFFLHNLNCIQTPPHTHFI